MKTCKDIETPIEEAFLMSLISDLKDIDYILRNEIPINMTKDDELDFLNAEICFFCQKDLLNDKVRDHDHINGKYRGAAHKTCNLIYSKPVNFIPIFFHNLGGNI